MSEKDFERILVMDHNLLYGFKDFDLKYKSVFCENGSVLAISGPFLHGVSSDDKDFIWFEECLRRSHFMLRGQVEDDTKYKQLIPYIIVRANGLVFTYQRSGNEHRLTGNYSIGIGGHTNLSDLGYSGIGRIIRNSALREISEELDFGDPCPPSVQFKIDWQLCRPRAFLYAGNSDSVVNHVHFGVVYIVDLEFKDFEDVTLREEGKKLDWMTKTELIENSDNLEEWSRLVLEKCL